MMTMPRKSSEAHGFGRLRQAILVLGLAVMSPVPGLAEAPEPLESTRTLSAAEILAATAPPAAPVPLASGGLHYQVRPAISEIVVDGHLDELAWQRATVIQLRYETRPGENIEPRVATEVLLTHDDRNLYAAFKAHDPEPAAIRAQLSDRDRAFSDDFVGLVLDTFNDERRAFEFFVNPLGVQMDLFNDDLSGREDESWDAIWDSAGRITEDGYTVEVAIPFSSLRFPAISGEQTWGIDVLRFYPRDQRYRIASQPMDRDVSCYLCQISKVTGFAGISPGRNLEIVPTATGGRTDSREDLTAGGLEAGSFDSELGLTMSWGITPNLTLNGAINPDFSQVEADAAQLDVNNQFALFFPEKRPFFLEGADFFNTRLNAVFTRNVADPTWGLKLSGKAGKNALGVFAARDAVTNLLFPGNQGSSSTSLDMETTDAVLRYRRDFGDSSALGVLFTGREGAGYANGVGGIDGVWRPTDADTFGIQLLASRTEYPDAVVAEFDQPAGAFDDFAGVLTYDHRTRNWNAWARYQDVGDGFRADMGFIPQVDYRFVVGGGERVWWGEEKNWWSRISFGGDWDLRQDGAGNLLERETEFFFNLEGPLQSHFNVWGGQRDRVFDGVQFDERYWGLWTEASPSGTVWFGFFVRGGDQIDFANTRPGKVLTLEPHLRLNLGRRTRIRLDHTYQALDVDAGRLFTANLSQLRVDYQFNLRTFLRLIAQYTTVERDPTLYLDDEVEAMDARLFSQLLFAYKLNPQTVLFLGYSDTNRGTETIDLTQESRTFFVKVGYAWVM